MLGAIEQHFELAMVQCEVDEAAEDVLEGGSVVSSVKKAAAVDMNAPITYRSRARAAYSTVLKKPDCDTDQKAQLQKLAELLSKSEHTIASIGQHLLVLERSATDQYMGASTPYNSTKHAGVPFLDDMKDCDLKNFGKVHKLAVTTLLQDVTVLKLNDITERLNNAYHSDTKYGKPYI